MNKAYSSNYMVTLNLYSKIKRSQKQQSEKKQNHTRLIALLFATIIASIFLASCGNVDTKYHFENNEDALGSYHSFLKSCQQKPSETTDELIASMIEWRTLRDTVFNYISKDPAFNAHTYLSSTFFSIHDSVKTEMIRLAVTDNTTYKDVLRIKTSTSVSHKEDSIKGIVSSANQFFKRLDGVSPRRTDKRNTLIGYRRFLSEADGKSFTTMTDVKDILREEDIQFRTFLTHINEYADESLSDIAHGTEKLCKGIYRSVSDSTFSATDVMVYMAMRTNRRLILNANACLESIKRGDELSESQQEAYYWMIVQPYIAIDGFALSVLSSEQTQTLLDNADEIHRIEQTRKLKVKNHKESEICSLILKILISAN